MESENGARDLDQPPAPITVQDLAIANAQGAFVLDPNFLQVTDKGTNAYDADTIYVTNGSSIFVTKNHGQSWTDRTSNLAGLGSIVDIEVDPRNRDTIYAVRAAFGGGHVFRSTDAGRTWINISNDLPNLPTWRIVIDPRNGFLYAGTDEGVSLHQRRRCLEPLRRRHADGAGPRPELNLVSNTLVAGTFGRSVFQHFLGSQQTLGTPVDAAVVALGPPPSGPARSNSSANPAPIASPWAPTARRTCRTRSPPPHSTSGPISDLTATEPHPRQGRPGRCDLRRQHLRRRDPRRGSALVVDNAHALAATPTAPRSSTRCSNCAPTSTPSRSRSTATDSRSTATTPAACATSRATTPMSAR